MGPLDVVRPYLGLIKLAIVAAAVLGGILWWRGFVAEQQQIGYDRAAGKYAVLLAEAKDAAAKKDIDWRDKLKGANDARTKLEQDLAAARSRAAGADERLRRATDDFSRRLSDATLEAARAAAATAAELLGQCGRRYREVAAAADGHAADVVQCEAAWPE